MRLIVVADKASNNGEGPQQDAMTRKVRARHGARWKTLTACAVAAWALASASAFAEDKIIVGLITKTNANPFFAKMKEGAQAKANELGVDFRSFAGKYDGDNTG
jgi:ABC-type sugar transport system substrate-binding protein